MRDAEPQPGSGPEQGTPLGGGDRGFSIAFAYGGLFIGGVIWIFWWGATHLPKRGEVSVEEYASLNPIDWVLLPLLPFGCAAIAGRFGRRWMP